MEIDHVFIIIDPKGCALAHLQSLGLTQTYRRQHQGQGTENVCFCFDNLFLEVLWINSPADLRSEKIARTKLYERSRWATGGTNPFGIAWRGSRDGVDPPISTWRFFPPYLSAGMGIDVAVDSDDARQPMMFESPGGSPPIDWPTEKKGALQQASGSGRVLGIDLHLPASVAPSPALRSIAMQTILNLQVSGSDQFSMTLYIEKHGSPQPAVLCLPV